MPYKARLQEGQERKRKKPTYRVTNCHEYNQSLKKRGQISLYFPDGDLLSQFIDASPYTRGVSGRTSSYRAPYVELIYTFYRPFSWGMRQIAGYMEDGVIQTRVTRESRNVVASKAPSIFGVTLEQYRLNHASACITATAPCSSV
jgi:hypothetical protein